MEDRRDVHSEESPNYLVRITGFSTKTTEDALLNFFENTRRSGGGEIKDIKLNQEENFADILFWSSEDAQRVVQKESLNLDGANLTATLKQIPKELPTDQRRLHVMGVSDKTIVDGLMSFMEVVSGGEVESMLFGSNSNAMVAFKEPPDFHELQKICKATSLDGSFIKIEQVKICDSIEISGFTQNTTDDTILYYFKNKRNEGGEVKKFEYISEITDKTIILSFEDPKVVDEVIKKDHVIDGTHLTVRRFYPFLGETSLTNPGSKEKERVVKVDPQTMLVIEEFFSQEFEQLLEQTHVKYMWKQDQGEMVLTCNEEERMDKKTWENSCEAVASYVNQIVTEKITVPQEIWQLMSDDTKEKCNESEHQIHILHIFDFKKKELSVVLRGKKTDVCVLAKRLNDLSLKIEKQMIFEKNKITKEIELSEAQIGLMRFCGFVEDLKGKFKDLEVTMKEKSEQQVIQLRGPEAEVNESHIAVWQLLSKMKESEIELPKSVVGILSSEAGKVIISTQLKNNSIGAVVSFDSDNQLLVTAVDRNDMNKAVHLIKDLTVKESILLDADQKQLISSEKWKEFKLSILQSMILQITEEPASSTLWIAGIKEEVYKAKEKVEVFFDENTKIDTERVSQRKTLTLDGTQLTMTLKEIPKEIPKDPNKLYVTGISDKTTKDGLMSFMEAASGREVESMLYGSYSNAMVTFMEPPDLEKVQKKSSSRTLDGSHLKIEQVNICDCIEVSRLAPNTNTDTIFYYFENPKKGGGDVKRVELDSKKARAVVFFENPSVVSNVTKINHVLNDVELTVVPYYPFLGETSTNPGGGKKEKVIKVDPDAIVFIKTFFLKEFNQLFEKTCLNYKWEEGSREIVLGCVEPKMVKEKWENSCEAVATYVNQIVTEKITVSQEAWKEMCNKAKYKYDSFRDRVEISRKEKELSFTLRGMKSDVCVLAEQLNDLLSEIKKQISFEKNKITKKIDLTETQIDLFSISGFVEDLKRFKDLEVTMTKKEQAIHFRGPDPVVREGNIAVWQTLSKLKETEVELPKSITSIVGSDAGKTFMLTKFKKNHIDAVISFDANSETQLMVTAVDRRNMKKAFDLIKDLTSEQSIPLDDDQKQIIQSEKWKKLLISIQSMLLQITEEPASSTLWIAGIKDDVEKAESKVGEFFEENIILDKAVETENGRVKYIFKYKADDIKNIEASLKNQSVKVKKYCEDDEEDGVLVSGTREGIEKAVPKVEKLINDVKDRRVDLDKPGMKKLFSEKKGSVLLSIVENDHNCIIERCPQSRAIKFSSFEAFDGIASCSKIICSYVTPEGKKIILYKGDLTEHKVDVMVNAANKRLQHVGGIAKSIINKGGQEIQDECNEYILRNGELLDAQVMVTGAGKLPCKRLVHAVGPMWSHGADKMRMKGEETKEERMLSQTIHSSLKKAKDYTSIALPAISSGVFRFPVDVCAQTLIESALEFSEENSHSKLTEIHFVDMNDSAIKAFHDEMKARFGQESSFIDGPTPKKETKKRNTSVGKGKGRGRGKGTKPIKDEPVTSSDLEDVGDHDDPNSITTAQGMKILVIVSDLAKEEAHAIVNTVASDLDLTRNPCAKALSNAAGPALQQECKDKGPLSVGKILVTDGYNLGCKKVFHVVAGDWQSGKGEQNLRSLVQSCLNEAHKRGFSSIAFPAIGTGKLGFPRDVVARLFFEEADAFKSENPQSPLNEVHLVLFHKDTPTVTAFQNELKNRKPRKAKGKRRSLVNKSEDHEDFENTTFKEPKQYSFVDIPDEDLSSSSYIGSIRLEIISGDITKENTNAIATVSNTSLSVAQGGVGAAIAKAGGPSIQKECDKLGTQKPGSVVSTNAGLLPTRRIFHLVSSSLNPADISEVVLKCFLKAESIGIKSIAIPAIGTGVGRINPKESAKALLSTIEKFSQVQPTSLNHIRIVVFQENMLNAFYNAIEDLSESKSGIWGTFWKTLKGIKEFFGGSGSSTSYTQLRELREPTAKDVPGLPFPVDREMWLKVFASNNKDLNKAEKDINELMKEHSRTKEIEHKAIDKLSSAQRERVLKIEAKHDTKIQIDKKINRIVVRGAAEDVSNTTLAIYDILNEKSEEEHKHRYAELLCKNVQWYYVDGDDLEPYESELNAQIEQAYKDNKPYVVLFLEGETEEEPSRYKIDFSSDIETNLDSGQTTRVERRDTAAGNSLPTHWDPQPKDSDGKEQDMHLVVLDPAKHKKEYDYIKTAIEKTSPINIIKIERVQNPSLYKAYLVKKQKMDNTKNGSNEKKLFHGTAQATCQLINHQGFNRSFCGKNATCYGKGVYFARDARYSMSSTYSPPDGTGRRYMYMASVLAGEYTVGQTNMLTPPPKNPNIPTDTYDTVVDNVTNPSIYVVFHDIQNYPDYLITFQ